MRPRWAGWPWCHGLIRRTACRTRCRSLREAGIDTLVSMLAPDEAFAMGLADEEAAALAAGMAFDALPTTDFAVPPSFESRHS